MPGLNLQSSNVVLEHYLCSCWGLFFCVDAQLVKKCLSALCTLEHTWRLLIATITALTQPYPVPRPGFPVNSMSPRPLVLCSWFALRARRSGQEQTSNHNTKLAPIPLALFTSLLQPCLSTAHNFTHSSWIMMQVEKGRGNTIRIERPVYDTLLRNRFLKLRLRLGRPRLAASCFHSAE